MQNVACCCRRSVFHILCPAFLQIHFLGFWCGFHISSSSVWPNLAWLQRWQRISLLDMLGNGVAGVDNFKFSLSVCVCVHRLSSDVRSATSMLSDVPVLDVVNLVLRFTNFLQVLSADIVTPTLIARVHTHTHRRRERKWHLSYASKCIVSLRIHMTFL